MKKTYCAYKSGILVSRVVAENGRISFYNVDPFTGRIGDQPEDSLKTWGSFQLNVKKCLDMKKKLEAAYERCKGLIELEGDVFERYADPRYPGLDFLVQRKVKHPVDAMIYRGKVIGFLQQHREHTLILAEEGYEMLTPLAQWHDGDISRAEFSVCFAGEHMVAMKDGVRLATSVWLPQGSPGQRWPVILIRTPYGRKGLAAEEMRYVQRGYALVAQDVRGREDSEGEWLPFAHEAADGAATLEWIASRDWCDGNIGMTGASYGGFVQWAAATSQNPCLKALVSIVTAGSPFGDVPRKGGTYPAGMLAWCFAMADRKVNRAAMERSDWAEVLRIRPIKDIPRRALGRDVPFWDRWMENPDYNSFWKACDWTVHAEKINVPSLIITGWYDDDFTGSMEAWQIMNRPGKQASRLLIGPWAHDVNTSRDIHNVAAGSNSLYYNIDLLHLRWFDRFLRGIKNGVENTRVEYYSLGSNTWHRAGTWPPEASGCRKFYLSEGGLLSDTGSSVEAFEKYVYDPLNPAPQIMDISENEMNVPGNYRDLEKRNDFVTFTTPPLKERISVAGHVKVVFYASSDARDTDWVVRLLDVDPEGNSIKLSQGILRARYRKSYEKPELLEPGRIERYEICMDDIASVFEKGHRIRLSFTSAAFEYALVNHNTGNDPASDVEFKKACQRIYYGGQYDSHLLVSTV